jgi:serine/threonine protein kinase
VDAFDLEFKEVVGKGSFGTVYRAVLRRPSFRKDVAVKLLHDRWMTDRVIMARLRDEARVLGLVRHRALPSAEGLFWVADRPALVTEFVEGVTLTQLRVRRPLPVSVALELCAEVASALHVAWTTPGPDGRPLHLVHRDIKPSNLQVTSAGEVKLLDFGVARADFAEREAETQNHLVGSLSYMSPERLDFIHGPEGDVYSLGVVLAEVLLGKRPERTSADRAKHEAFLQSLQNTLAALHGSSTSLVVSLVRELLAYEASERPTAREVERKCLELRRSVGGPHLSEWAEKAVADARTTRQVIEEPTSVALLGATLPARPPEGLVSLPPTALEAEESPTPTPPTPTTPPAPPTPPPATPLAVDGPDLLLGGPTVARSEAPAPPRAPAAPLQQPPPASPRWGLALALTGVGLVVAVALLGLVLGATGLGVGWVDGVAEADPPLPPPPAQPMPAPTPEAAPPEPASPVPSAVLPTPAAPPTPGGVRNVTQPGPAPARPPKPGPAPSGGSGGPVTAAAFSAFVGSHPEWTHDEAIARKRASEQYLQGWTGTSPPAGAKAVTHVSFYAAVAYCAARGGLAGLDAPPTTWTEGSGPFQEWRLTPEGAPAWRRFDGVVSTAVRRADANGFTGFRCAK